MNVQYRAPLAQDLPFIMATWLKGQRHQGDRAFMTHTTYFDNEKKRIEKLLSVSNILIIADKEDQTHIFGYMVYSELGDLFIIHYAHLKKAYRRLGIMRQVVTGLYPQTGRDEIAITHINELVASLRERCKLKFNPYLEDYF